MSTLEFISSLLWPFLCAAALFYFREDIRHALGRGKLKLQLFGCEVEIRRDKLQELLNENWNYFEPTEEQWKYLERLTQAENQLLPREPHNPKDLQFLRPLRNAGLIAGEKGGFLQDSKEVRLTPLGRFLIASRSES